MAETVVVDPAVLLPQLIAENAELKTRIGLPEHECVLQSVLQEHLQRFFDDARRVLDLAVSQSVGLSGDGDRVEGADCPSALIESLRALSAQNETLLRELAETHSSRVLSLLSQVDALSSERDALLSRVRALEDESAAASSPPALLCELRALRASESALRAELDAVSLRGAAAVAAAEALSRGGADAALSLPPVLERLAALRVALHGERLGADALRVALQEAEGRAALRHQTELGRLSDEAAAARAQAALFAAELTALRGVARQHEAHAARLAAELTALRDELRLAAKRRRTDGGAGDEEAAAAAAAAALSQDSVRREAVAFWRDGRAELERLRREQSHYRKAREKGRALQERLLRVERERGAFVAKVAALAEELGRARDEAQELRAQAAGLAVERDFLRASLADLLAAEMREEDVARAAQLIRDAAAAQQRSLCGGGSSGSASDPQRAQQLEKAQQELRADIARLERQRDRLQQHIALREERIVALHTQEDLLRISSAKGQKNEKDGAIIPQSGEGHSFVAISDGAHRLGDVCPPAQALTVEETVFLAEAHANDALDAAALDAEASSFGARTITHTALQSTVLSLNAQLRACRSDLETIAAERDSARAQLHATESELRKALDANSAALRSALERNASLSRDSAALRSAHTSLQSVQRATATLLQRFVSVLAQLLALHRSGTSVAAALHRLLRDERRATAELTRRAAAEALLAPDTELDRVVAALERVGDAVAQATAQRAMRSSAAEAQHVKALAAAVQRQDEALRALHVGFANECRAIGEGVAQRIAEAVRAGDGQWRARVAQIAEERNALQAQIAAEREILAGMQHTLTAQPREMSRQDEEEEEGHRHVEDADESEVLVVIQKLLAAVVMPSEACPTTETVSHTTGEEHAEEKEGWKRSGSATPEVEIEKQKPIDGEENEEGNQEIEEEKEEIEEEKQEIEEEKQEIEEEKQEIEVEKQEIEEENEEVEKKEWNHEEYEGEEESPKM